MDPDNKIASLESSFNVTQFEKRFCYKGNSGTKCWLKKSLMTWEHVLRIL